MSDSMREWPSEKQPAPQGDQIPEDLKGLWAEAKMDEDKPWHWEQITPKQLLALIERIAVLEGKLARYTECVVSNAKMCSQIAALESQLAKAREQVKTMSYNPLLEGAELVGTVAYDKRIASLERELAEAQKALVTPVSTQEAIAIGLEEECQDPETIEAIQEIYANRTKGKL